MIPLNSPELERLAKLLGKYDFRSTVPQLAGLLTAPSLHANTLRLRTIVHLAVAHCRGRRKPTLTSINQWLNGQLGNTTITKFEDPSEDVFVTNVETPEGNRRIFQGIWNSNDYFAQAVIDILSSRQAPRTCQNLLYPALALLKISDSVAKRVRLQRWHVESSTPRSKAKLVPTIRVVDRAHAVTFTNSELDALGINRDLLIPFILAPDDRQLLLAETIGHTSLERHPLVDIDGKLVLALPHAVSPAIRRFVLSKLRQTGYLSSFTSLLADYQASQVKVYGFKELETNNDSLSPPSPNRNIPSLQDWLVRYDINKYLHVVLLQGQLDGPSAENLTSLVEYPEKTKEGLEKYLNEVADYCISLPDFTEGMTLLIIGGLGPGLCMRFKDWSNQWYLSMIRISDFLMLSNESNRQIIYYLKSIKQKKWVEKEDTKVLSSDDDYNFYCLWRQSKYQFVPSNFPLGYGHTLFISNSCTLPIRKKVRRLLDIHTVQTTTGFYVPVIRFGNNTYFESIHDRPIYVSLSHLSSGILAGVVETSRGSSWLLVDRYKGDEKVHHFLYQMWEGFIGLYDKLVFEVESLYKRASSGPIEIQLDFSKVIVPDDLKFQKYTEIREIEVVVSHDHRAAVVKFPSEIIQCFQQPENTGEILVLRSIAKGLVKLHQGANKDIEEPNLDILINKVISDSGMRVLHSFSIYPVRQLQERQNIDPIFLAQEDFAFYKLKLSEGCKPNQNDTNIRSKSECNKFLHKVVDKIWNQLRGLLQQLDRTSVIREVLLVHEAIILDRERWRQTARAILALYASDDDVHSIAQEREIDRTHTSLSSRTILEMAICECPETGGRSLSRWGLDELLAKAALLIEVATHSDAVRSDLTQPRIDLFPNGEYTIDRSFHTTVIKSFRTAHLREEFDKDVQEYGKLYKKEPSDEQKRADETFSSDFIRAFQAEFGLTLDEMLSGFVELFDLAIEHDNIIVETTLGDIKNRLISNRGLSTDAAKAFVSTFGSFHRHAWDAPPRGFKAKDIYPWRLYRRLSVTSRPILIFGHQDKDKVLFGVGTLKVGGDILLDRLEQGHLSQDFFTSAEMKQYTGAVTDEKGHAFAQLVAEQLSKKGWQVRNEVQMTQLGASAELGDVDVLAWKPGGKIQIIECKRLRLARSVAEVAEICRRFRGEAKDELGKHVRRINWIKANPKGLQSIIGFVPNPARIDDRLVTNTHVPMTYLTSLPIEAKKIGPLK